MSYHSHNVLIVGDFNMPKISWVDSYAAIGNNKDQIDPFFGAYMRIHYIKILISQLGTLTGHNQNRSTLFGGAWGKV